MSHQNTQPYGTISNGESRAENGISSHSDETQALLGPKPGSRSWLRKRLGADVRRDWADVMLLACYIITGILDSASISTWGAFVSMQTGTTLAKISSCHTDVLDRKYCLSWSWSNSGNKPVEKVWIINPGLLHRFFLLQPSSQGLHANPKTQMGILRIFRHPDSFHHRSGINRDLGPQGCWPGRRTLVRNCTNRPRRIPKLRAGRRQQSPQVQRPHERRADQHLLRPILRRSTVRERVRQR